jgi:pyridoxamine-phosphate oxidase
MTTLLATLDRNPLRQLKAWLDDATLRGLKEPNAMSLATASRDGRPSVRVVLCKDVDDDSFSFYTNFDSRKGGELAMNPVAAVVFYWPDLDRQVRLEGPVRRVSDQESDAYFASRPRGSQVGAWTSPQSQTIPSFASLNEAYDMKLRELAGKAAVQRPPYWGGYRLEPETCEFWLAMPSRLHDRVRCQRSARVPGVWEWEQVAP